jgi:RecA/RadA recombinase
MNTEHVHVFFGDPIEDPGELRFLHRLRTDLAGAGAPAFVFANFVANPSRGSRQIDFLVLTEQRLTHVELKSVVPTRPVDGPANGPWSQRLAGGGEHRWDGNAYRQAKAGTYAISDDLRRLVRAGFLPDDGQPYRTIDTVVCLAPEIPDGSALQRFEHVRAVGYTELLDRLLTKGPRPTWTREHAETLARSLNLFTEHAHPQVAGRLRADLNALDDYRARFLQRYGQDLHELIPVTAVDQSGAVVQAPLANSLQAMEEGQVLNITGVSGTGKTHTAQHAAVHAATAGHVPIWVRCQDHESDSFAVAMARATAALTTEPWHVLLDRARRQGRAPAIVLDGLNQCSPDRQRELLDGVTSYRLRAPVALIVTSQDRAPLPGALVLTTRDPDAAETAAILASYGVDHLPDSTAFTTPMELALAASCARDVTSEMGTHDVMDLYVRQCTTNEEQRDHLRALAFAMQRSVSFSTGIGVVRTLIGDLTGSTPSASDLDSLLSSRLVHVGPQRVSFRHELFGRFLAAQYLVLHAQPGPDLAAQLEIATLANLRQIATALEPDGLSRASTLIALGDSDLLADAVRGHAGTHTQRMVTAEVRQALLRAAAITDTARFTYTDDPQQAQSIFSGHWTLDAAQPGDNALLIAAGQCLHDGLLVAETAQLLDTTDARSATAIAELRALGVGAPISAVVATTYTTALQGLPGDELPGTILLRACAGEQHCRWGDRSLDPRATRIRFTSNEPARWGRLMAAILTLNSDSAADLALVPDLVKDSWQVGGYHLRLAALDLAHRTAWRMTPTAKQTLGDVVDDFDVSQNIFLSSLVVEVLAACDAIEPLTTADAIAEDIAQVLAAPNDYEARARARGILASQFEDERIFGPYSETIGQLEPAELVVLCAMGVLGDEDNISIATDWAVSQIADHIDVAGPDVRGLIERLAAGPPADRIMAYEGVRIHLEALRAWSRIAPALPAVAPTSDLGAGTWRLIDELVFPLMEQGDPCLTDADAQAIWNQLLDLYAPTAIDALHHVRLRYNFRPDRSSSCFEQLVDRWPAQYRTLLEWGLTHPDLLRPAVGAHLHSTTADVMQALGRVGNEHSRQLLTHFLDDPDLAADAVAAIRAIERDRHPRPIQTRDDTGTIPGQPRSG